MSQLAISSASPSVKVLPLPRANNVAIMLTQFSSFSSNSKRGGGGGGGGGASGNDDLGAAVRRAIVAGEAALSVEHLALLLQLAPKDDEVQKAFTKNGKIIPADDVYLTKPDPLADVLADTFGASLIDADELRAALEARGLEIREKI